MRLGLPIKEKDPGARSLWIDRDQGSLLQSVLEAADRCYYGVSGVFGQHIFGPNLDHARPACLCRREYGLEFQ